MKITKIGHCCLIIEVDGLKIMTDPGEYSTGQNQATDIDVILITHEHPDHLHIDSLKQVLQLNPQAQVITNDGVGAKLQEASIPFELVRHNEQKQIQTVLIEGFGEKHAAVYPSITPVDNTGYLIANKFFYPGDALTNPERPVEILALPVAGPWLKISEAIDYAKTIKPNHCFPVHDAMLMPNRLGSVHVLPEKELKLVGINFIVIPEGSTGEF